MDTKDYFIVSLLAVAILFGVLYYTQDNIIINNNTERVEQLKKVNDSLILEYKTISDLNSFLIIKINKYDSIIKQDSLKLKLIKAKYEKEINKYKAMPVDSAYVEWSKLSSSRE